MRSAIIVVLIFVFSAAPAFAQIRFGTPILAGGGSAVNPGDVYGSATFELRPLNGQSIQQAVQGIVGGIVATRYGTTEGTYLFTIEVSQNGSTIAVQPLVTVGVQNQRFLFWTTASSVTQDLTYSGSLLTTGAVTDRNNRVQISLKSYYKRSSTFDTSAFDLLNQLVSDYSLVSALDAVGLSAGVLDTAKSILTKMLSDSDDSTEHVKFEMSFAQLNSVDDDRVRTAEVPVYYSIGGVSGGLTLYLKTWSVSSRFAFDTATRQYTSPRSDVFLNQTGVMVGDKFTNLTELAAESGPKEVKDFLAAGLAGTEVSGSAPIACSRLLSYFSRYLSNRDSLAMLWATLREYRDGFGTATAQCVDARAAAFTELGLSTDDMT